MNVNGYILTGDWKASNIGYTARATKGSKKYFLKRYGNFKMPRNDESVNPKLYARLEKEFNSFMENRIAINKKLSDLAGTGGNIILPTHWFIDDIYYIEATEFVDNLIEDEDILKLPLENKLFIMLTAAGALHNIHRKNIVHSDLKRTNILAARNSAGNTVAKIIDFDISYFANNIRPDELGGDQNFMSPELAQCFMYDFAEEAIACLSTKSDIFSLGLVFHDYLVKGHPKIEGLTGKLKERVDNGKTVYACEALLAGGELVISKKIPYEYLSHLIAAMLQPEPKDRPTAQEVLEVLKTKSVLELKSDSAVRLEGSKPKKSVKPDKEPEKTSTPESSAPDTEPKPAATGFSKPWEEHGITVNTDKLEAAGFVSLECIEHKGTKCYKAYKRSGDTRVFNKDSLMLAGYAYAEAKPSSGAAKPETAPHAKKPESPSPSKTEKFDDGELWEKDGAYRFDIDNIKKSGYKSVSRAKRKDVEGYELKKPSGDTRFTTIEQLKMLGFAVKK